MGEMVERVKRAICCPDEQGCRAVLANSANPLIEQMCEADSHTEQAIAAIAAMRESTDAFVSVPIVKS